ETVFRDLHLRTRLLHLLTQSLHLGNGEAGIVSHHHNVRGLEDPAQVGDGLSFCRSIHCKLFPVWRLARVTREPPGCYQPSRLKFTHSEPGRTTIRKACPPKRPCGRKRVSEVRTKLAHFVGAQTRVVSPSMLAPVGD